MKKVVLLLIGLFITTFIFANDAYFFMAGGHLVPTSESDTQVEMKEEVINIVLETGYYEITVDFSFYNHGKTETLEVGFPFFCVGYGNGKISDFKCWTNGVEENFTDQPIEKEWQKDTNLENAYVRKITFPSKEITKTKITYKSTYGEMAPSNSIVKYLYGTGSGWKNSIGKMTVRIKNNVKHTIPTEVELPTKAPVRRIDSKTWEGVYTKIEPKNYTDCITIELGDLFGDDGPKCLSKDRFLPCRVLLKKEWLSWYTPEQLRLLRNAIYAFNGYPFKSQDLIDLFEVDCVKRWWYGFIDGGPAPYPLDKYFSEDKLNYIEKNNIKMIQELEDSIKAELSAKG
ncbi:MAG: YARHG domain-containing protein [Treponema sp.]|nr:YARHG domain-containing protein [Treponema sp.]